MKLERNHNELILDILDFIFLKICNIFDYLERKIEKQTIRKNKTIYLKDLIIYY